MSEDGWDGSGRLLQIANRILQWLSDSVGEVERWVAEKRANCPGASPEDLAQMAIREAQFWSGASGFVAGMADFLGPWGFTAGMSGDTLATAKAAVQMAQRIYAAHGHNIADDVVKLRIITALGAGGANLGSRAGSGAALIGRRLTEKYLRGQILKAIKAFLRRLGIVFTRKALVAWMPVVGSAVNLAVNRTVMGQLGKQVLSAVRA
jgi:hypothetical protein